MRTQCGRNANKELIINNKELNKEKYEEWLSYKSKKKKPVSELACKKQIEMLAKYTKEQQELIIDQSITNDWQGLFPPKENDNAKSSRHSNKSAATRTAENIQKEFGQRGSS
jgi:hypothetical protein